MKTRKIRLNKAQIREILIAWASQDEDGVTVRVTIEDDEEAQ
jgi:hypothetical protein